MICDTGWFGKSSIRRYFLSGKIFHQIGIYFLTFIRPVTAEIFGGFFVGNSQFQIDQCGLLFFDLKLYHVFLLRRSVVFCFQCVFISYFIGFGIEVGIYFCTYFFGDIFMKIRQGFAAFFCSFVTNTLSFLFSLIRLLSIRS